MKIHYYLMRSDGVIGVSRYRSEKDAERAARCAISLQKKFRALLKELKAKTPKQHLIVHTYTIYQETL